MEENKEHLININEKIIDVENATEKQKSQKKSFKTKIATWLTVAGIGVGVGVSALSGNNDNIDSQPSVNTETTMEEQDSNQFFLYTHNEEYAKLNEAINLLFNPSHVDEQQTIILLKKDNSDLMMLHAYSDDKDLNELSNSGWSIIGKSDNGYEIAKSIMSFHSNENGVNFTYKDLKFYNIATSIKENNGGSFNYEKDYYIATNPNELASLYGLEVSINPVDLTYTSLVTKEDPVSNLAIIQLGDDVISYSDFLIQYNKKLYETVGKSR